MFCNCEPCKGALGVTQEGGLDLSALHGVAPLLLVWHTGGFIRDLVRKICSVKTTKQNKRTLKSCRNTNIRFKVIGQSLVLSEVSYLGCGYTELSLIPCPYMEVHTHQENNVSGYLLRIRYSACTIRLIFHNPTVQMRKLR